MPSPPLYTVIPFVAMLLAIALGPLAAPRWWEANRHKLYVSVALGVPVLGFYLVRQPSALTGAAEEYVSFVVLLAGLYAISGGILLQGNLEATPLTNTAFLGLGAALASFIGTTGASLLLIRPLLQTNRERQRVKHTVIFFVFLVSNIGGLLTPLGDPPLFLGYLRGVPFTWTFRLWLHWLMMLVALLVVYFCWDSVQHALESTAALRRDRRRIEPLRVRGIGNIVLLAGVAVAVGLLRAPVREAVIVAFAGLSLWRTPHRIRRENGVTASPMIEVATLFLGIFITMIPALEVLRLRGHELSVREPWQFFWASGLVSSFLDNAPTYLAFVVLGQGLGLADEVIGMPHALLAAISVGSVVMGANSYIGNAPNFMVKAIAEEAGVRMPNFIGYMAYSAGILLPLFVVLTYLFF